MIIHGETGARIHVYRLSDDHYCPKKNEYHFFGEDYGAWLAFETENYNEQDLTVIAHAIAWYARYKYTGTALSTVRTAMLSLSAMTRHESMSLAGVRYPQVKPSAVW